MSPFKINVVVRYLERAGVIIIDTDSYIVWTRREAGSERPTLGEVATISKELKDLLAAAAAAAAAETTTDSDADGGSDVEDWDDGGDRRQRQ